DQDAIPVAPTGICLGQLAQDQLVVLVIISSLVVLAVRAVCICIGARGWISHFSADTAPPRTRELSVLLVHGGGGTLMRLVVVANQGRFRRFIAEVGCV